MELVHCYLRSINIVNFYTYIELVFSHDYFLKSIINLVICTATLDLNLLFDSSTFSSINHYSEKL